MSKSLLILIVIIAVVGGGGAWYYYRTHLKIRFQRRDTGFLKRGDAADAEPYQRYGEAEPQAAARNPVSEPKWNFEMGSNTTGGTIAPSPGPLTEESPHSPAPLQSSTEDTQAVVITYTDAGYAPAAVTVKKGAAVTFRNESRVETWPASAMHPAHTAYPGTDIENCGTAGREAMFDACRGLKTGETWSFTFQVPGKWGYHDHLRARHFGSITVTE